MVIQTQEAFSEPKPVREHPQLLQLSLEPPALW